ncbi:MAG: ANTAR domain-containing protein [Oscillospiraceae bacterium]|nr:ANTAR domain-containing protein [Oscillospiraceae bacterium]
MSLEERRYSVLVVSAAARFQESVSGLLADAACGPVIPAAAVGAAERAVLERPFDFVIVNSPLPDDPGTRFAADLCARQGTAALLLVRTELYAETRAQVTPHGVFTLPKPTTRQTLALALSWMAAARERLRRLEKKTLSIEEKMEEIRLVNRAKWLLVSELSMTEPDAHRYMEKQAMDLCVPKRQVAENILKTYR